MKSSHISLVAAYHATGSATSGSDDYQNGWKDCHSHILNMWAVFDAFINSLSPGHKQACIYLLSETIITLVYEDNKVRILLPCSDTFAYACADQEYIEPTSLATLAYCYQQWKNAGVIAWLSITRGVDPLPCLCDDKYREARSWME